MYKIIAIAGKSGAGKDTLLREFVELDTDDEYIHEIISCTTRPRRQNELNGINYHFVSSEEFTTMLYDGSMIEATVFNDWCYGTSLAHLDENKINVGVFNPEGIGILADTPNVILYIVYVTASDKTRLMRQLTREENPNIDEIIRRYSTDKQDFKYFKDEFLTPDNHWVVLENEDGVDLKKAAAYMLPNAIQYLDGIR